ncbi:hypothetical protein Tco_1160685 [Tanacetum coccineum]
MPRDDPIIERIPRRSLKKRNITPSKNELPHIGSNVAFEENMISRFNIGIARRTRDGRNIHTTRREIQSMRESVQGKPPHKHIDLPGDRFIPSSSMSKSGKDILVNPITSILNGGDRKKEKKGINGKGEGRRTIQGNSIEEGISATMDHTKRQGPLILEGCGVSFLIDGGRIRVGNNGKGEVREREHASGFLTQWKEVYSKRKMADVGTAIQANMDVKDADYFNQLLQNHRKQMSKMLEKKLPPVLQVTIRHYLIEIVLTGDRSKGKHFLTNESMQGAISIEGNNDKNKPEAMKKLQIKSIMIYTRGSSLWYRKINYVDSTIDEIKEQSENLKQIQESDATPFSGQEFDEAASDADKLLSFFMSSEGGTGARKSV